MACLGIGQAKLVRSEPVGLRLTITNDTSREIEFLASRRGLKFLCDWEIIFTATPGGPLLRPLAPMRPPLTYDGPFPMVVLRPGEKWATIIYLQQYVQPIAAGVYDVSCVARVPFQFRDESRQKRDGDGYIPDEQVLEAKAEIGFEVAPAAPERLAAVIRDYAADGGEDAEAALCVIDDPAVIPALIGQIDRSWSQERIVEALERFRADAQTKSLLLAKLSSADSQIVCSTLDTLAGLKYIIPQEDLDHLLKSQDQRIRRTVHKYTSLKKELSNIDLD